MAVYFQIASVRTTARRLTLGLAGILTVRVFAMGSGWNPRGRVSALQSRGVAQTIDGGAYEVRPRGAVPGRWQSALVDDALDDSFPASDPPSWTGMHSGPPRLP